MGAATLHYTSATLAPQWATYATYFGPFFRVGGEQRGSAPKALREANLVARKKDARAGVTTMCKNQDPGPSMAGRRGPPWQYMPRLLHRMVSISCTFRTISLRVPGRPSRRFIGGSLTAATVGAPGGRSGSLAQRSVMAAGL